MNSAWGLIWEVSFHRVPGGDAADQGTGLPKCKILFPPRIQSVRVNVHSPAPPEPDTDGSVNSLIAGVLVGLFSYLCLSPDLLCFFPGLQPCPRMHILKIPIHCQGKDRMFQPPGRPLGYLAVAVITFHFLPMKFPLCRA